MKIKSPVLSRAIALSGFFLGAFALAVAAGTWSAPTSSAPDGNVAAPINVGGGGTGTDLYPQIKTGILTLNNLVAKNMNVASGTIASAGSVLTNDGKGNASWAAGGGSGSIPSGAIMAFALNSCPSDWDPYIPAQGRFILGTSTSGIVESTGGASTHTLTIAELPAFQVSFTLPIAARVQANLASNKAGHEVRDTADAIFKSTSIGGGKAYSIMPPYVTELYCKKK